MRLVALATLLDPRADLMVADFGGGMDFKPFKPFARKWIHGEAEEQVKEFRALLRWLRAEYQRRQRMLSELPVEDVPESRITEALAHQARFRPIVVVVDEFQVATRSNKDIVTEWAELEKVCRKVGIWIVKATQAADDSVPTELRNISLQRLALTVATYQASISLLGNTAYNRGLDASQLGGVRGYGIVWGVPSPEFEGYQGKVSFANCTPADANAMLKRIATWRPTYDHDGDGTPDRPLVDMFQPEPDGDAPDTDADEESGAPLILRDVLTFWPKGHMYCHRDVMATALDMDPAELSRQLREAGVNDGAVRMKRTDGGKEIQRGWHLADVEAAAR